MSSGSAGSRGMSGASDGADVTIRGVCPERNNPSRLRQPIAMMQAMTAGEPAAPQYGIKAIQRAVVMQTIDAIPVSVAPAINRALCPSRAFTAGGRLTVAASA